MRLHSRSTAVTLRAIRWCIKVSRFGRFFWFALTR
jgi:hypothetical protein